MSAWRELQVADGSPPDCQMLCFFQPRVRHAGLSGASCPREIWVLCSRVFAASGRHLDQESRHSFLAEQRTGSITAASSGSTRPVRQTILPEFRPPTSSWRLHFGSSNKQWAALRSTCICYYRSVRTTMGKLQQASRAFGPCELLDDWTQYVKLGEERPSLCRCAAAKHRRPLDSPFNLEDLDRHSPAVQRRKTHFLPPFFISINLCVGFLSHADKYIFVVLCSLCCQ